MAGGQFRGSSGWTPPVLPGRRLPDDAQFAGGRALITRVKAEGVTLMQGAQVWGAFEPLDLMLFDGKASRLCRPKRLIVATGAYERGLPVPGWTLPGVMTTGACADAVAQLWRTGGQTRLVAGNGPPEPPGRPGTSAGGR